MAARVTDALVIGSGLGGLLFALRVAEACDVVVVTKKSSSAGNTWRAQGGVAAPVGMGDSPQAHVEDTLNAGAGLSREGVALAIVGDGPRLIGDLEALGVRFTRSESGDGFALGREGAHRRRRILHVQDATGRNIMEVLLERVRAHPRITLLEGHMAVDLILASRAGSAEAATPAKSLHLPPAPRMCETSAEPFAIDGPRDRVLGAFVLRAADRVVETVTARVTLLATGGCGKVYRYTSNSDAATGDGVAMAYRAGARVADLEFIQFHPTCLFHPQARTFLISEAVRGEGGFLTTLGGERFLEAYDPRGDLASRDIVARAIDREMKRRGEKHVYLHMEHLGSEKIRERFPNIHETCRRYGIEVESEPIPVVPAAHYMCGGVVTDLRGRTDLEGLLAAGEVACTGFHGANRLASNSLLETAFLAEAAAREAIDTLGRRPAPGPAPVWDPGSAVEPKESVLVGAHWDMVRTLMWNFVGIVRRDHRLDLVSQYMRNFRNSIEGYFRDFLLDPDLVELRNLALVAHLIGSSAKGRRETRGLHANEDHPGLDARAADTLIDPRLGTSVPA